MVDDVENYLKMFAVVVGGFEVLIVYSQTRMVERARG